MTTDAIGGVWQYSLELASGLGERGFDVTLAVMGGGVTDAKREEVTRLPNVQLFKNGCKLEWMDLPWDDVAASGEWLLHIADEIEPDIIHLNGYCHAALPWQAPVIVAAHSCVLSWFEAVRKTKAPSSWGTYRKAVQRGLAAADLVVAPSRFMRDTLYLNYGNLPETRVILNGRNPSAFHSGPKQDFILSAGRLWDEGKNTRILQGAAPGIAWPLYVAGESSEAVEGLRLLGNLDPHTLSDWYSRAAIYAHPALYEPFGLTVLEAALSGCALVLSDISSLREIWGDAACYVDAADTSAWRDRLNSLASNPLLRAALVEKSQKRALALTASQMTERYLEAYKQARINRTCASPSSVIPSAPTGIMEMPTFSAA